MRPDCTRRTQITCVCLLALIAYALYPSSPDLTAEQRKAIEQHLSAVEAQITSSQSQWIVTSRLCGHYANETYLLWDSDVARVVRIDKPRSIEAIGYKTFRATSTRAREMPSSIRVLAQDAAAGKIAITLRNENMILCLFHLIEKHQPGIINESEL